MNHSRAQLPHIRRRWEESGALATVQPRRNINGTYLGFSPTDESALAFGEFKLVITQGYMTYEFATGLKIERQRLKRRYWRELTPTEVASHFNEGAEDVADVTGITFGRSGISILFLRQIQDTASVLIIGMFGCEVFGPTALFTPAEVGHGTFERAVSHLETGCDAIGKLPRLKYGGRSAA